MADLYIEDIRDNDELVAIATYLLQCVARGIENDLIYPGSFTLPRRDGTASRPTAGDLYRMYDWDEFGCYDRDHSVHCTCVWDAADTDPRQGELFTPGRSSGPVRFTACPERGTHEDLGDCWMCWGDVERGAIIAAEALTPREAVS